MNLINNFNNSVLNQYPSDAITKKTTWCDIRSITNKLELTQQYTDICQKHDTDNKWILMINPENEPLQLLSEQGKIDPTKILKVNIHQRNITLKTIEHALEKGHCSAVILCNATLEQAEVLQLTHYAEKGQTKCIILKKQTQNAFNQLLSTKCSSTPLSSAQLH